NVIVLSGCLRSSSMTRGIGCTPAKARSRVAGRIPACRASRVSESSQVEKSISLAEAPATKTKNEAPATARRRNSIRCPGRAGWERDELRNEWLTEGQRRASLEERLART